MKSNPTPDFPRIEPLGLDGLLVRFSDSLSESANRAVLAFREDVESTNPPGLFEAATSLAAVFVRFDPHITSHQQMRSVLVELLRTRDWYETPLPHDRRLWRIPTVFGGETAPHLTQAAKLAGRTATQTLQELSTTRLRILAIGFAPGQPYVGQLGAHWNLPRQTNLQTRVPPGALALAVRQMVLFPAETQTGWYHVGQTGFRCFRPENGSPFPLQPGDEVMFPVAADLQSLRNDPSGNGGATCEPLP